MDITMALMLDITLAGKLEVNVGLSFKFDAEATIDITPKHIKQAVAKIEALGTNTITATIHSYF